MTVLPFKPRPPERPLDPIIRCRDISGQCCDSCHDQSDDMVEPLVLLTNRQGIIVARVCCLKAGEAGRRHKRPPEHKGGVLSTPSGKCLRLRLA